MKRLFVLLLSLLLISTPVYANSLDVQTGGIASGIAGSSPAVYTLDLINTDMEDGIEGYLNCEYENEDYVISSSLGNSEKDYKYKSPKFRLGAGYGAKTVTMYILSDTSGVKNFECTIYYLGFKDLDRAIAGYDWEKVEGAVQVESKYAPPKDQISTPATSENTRGTTIGFDSNFIIIILLIVIIGLLIKKVY